MKDNIPNECRAFWETAYSQMGAVSDKQEILKQAGYESIGHFALPTSDWDDYYAPIKSRLPALRASYEGDAEKLSVIEETELEIALFEKYRDCYTYVFYLARIVD